LSWGDYKEAMFHFEAAAMAGHDGARYNLGSLEGNSGNKERDICDDCGSSWVLLCHESFEYII
jgi:TPR repeat protein